MDIGMKRIRLALCLAMLATLVLSVYHGVMGLASL